jgi:hypothetical protein
MSNKLVKWLVVSSAAQLALVVLAYLASAYHVVPIIGTVIPLIVGGAYAASTRGSWGDATWGAALVGGLGALIGAAIAVPLNSDPNAVATLVTATGASAVAGLVGGVATHAVVSRKASVAASKG